MPPKSPTSAHSRLRSSGNASLRAANRALAHCLDPRTALLAAALVCLTGFSGCTEQEAASPRIKESPKVLIERLIELSTDLDPTLTSDHHDRHFHAREAFVAEMRQAPPEVGLEALRTFQEFSAGSEEVPKLVQKNLLEVAAYAATEQTVPLLEKLTLEFGHDMSARTEGMLLLGQVAPARAVEILTPMLKKTKQTSTMPKDEFMLRAYVTGCKGSGQDPVKILADVATNIYKEDAARHQAVQELGEHSTPYAQQALRTLLVESTGNAYLRIKAAQAIRKSFPAEQACAIFQEVALKEADTNFLLFLADMIQENCE